MTINGYDVFVSYAHADDRSLDESPGFISRFCDAIEVMGRFKRGSEIRIFRDRNMATGTAWAPEIKRALESSLIFLPVVSASWQQSTYADLEWNTFKNAFPTKLESITYKPVFPILFETEIGNVEGELHNLQINHHFWYGMTRKEFVSAADAAISELVRQIQVVSKAST
jgi:hypothetical protein